MTPRSRRARRLSRRTLPAARVGALGVAGCDRLSQTEWFPKVLGAGEKRERGASRSVVTVAQGDGAGVHRQPICSPTFRSNGTAEPDNARIRGSLPPTASPTTRWRSTASSRSRDASRSPNCARCRAARRSRGTIASKAGARSANGRARGSSALLDAVQPKPAGALRGVPLRRSDGRRRHDRLLREHRHGRRVPSADDPRLRAERRSRCRSPNGAPLRLRVERQLGYKHAKYVMRLELVESFAAIGGGRAATGRTRATSGTRGSKADYFFTSLSSVFVASASR